jgi:hypothetical protein
MKTALTLIIGGLVGWTVAIAVINHMVTADAQARFGVRTDTKTSSLTVEQEHVMQQYKPSQEDELRAYDVAQPTYLGVQVTQHEMLLEPGQARANYLQPATYAQYNGL